MTNCATVTPKNHGFEPDDIRVRGDWFIFRTKPLAEQSSIYHLEQLGMHAATPIRRVWRKVNNKVKKKTLKCYPAFSGYIFLCLAPEEPLQWHEIFRVPGITQIVRNGPHIEPIPHSQMAWIMDRLRYELTPPTAHRFMRSCEEYEIGDSVRVFKDGFEGVAAKVIGITDDNATVLMPLFNGLHEIQVRHDVLRRL